MLVMPDTFSCHTIAALSPALYPPISRSILCITNRHARAMLVMPDTFSRQEKAALSPALHPPMSRSILCIINRHARAMLVMPDTFSCHTMPFYLVKKKQLSAPLSTPP